ncbi:MAG TPA: cytochrome c-type biogenesis protein [Azospirillaceae bacterium]|nr:cytochrome c-type biogenesis protein [Azospirillaceae bacterium]
MRRLIPFALLGLLAAAPAFAVEPGEMLADPQLEARARELSRDLRCLVCQNQSIDDSNAPLARDLRVLVRERLKAGDSNEQAVNYLVDRYGDYVLLKPPFKTTTYILWFAPLGVLALGLIAVGAFYANRRRAGAATGGDTAPLTADEKKRLERLLGGNDR